jgi:DNA-nicking Smr family endonuclease
MDELIEFPMDGRLDLHTFDPRDVKDLVPEYIRACREENIFQIRIIHGKGKGVLRKIVHSILRDLPEVLDFWQEGAAGSWGATVVKIKMKDEQNE